MSKRKVRSFSGERMESKASWRSRSTSSSNYSSLDESLRRRHHSISCHSSHSDSKRRDASPEKDDLPKRKIGASEFICLYDNTYIDNPYFPQYLKKAGADAIIMKVEPFIFKPQVFRAADFSIVDERLLSCFSACLEEMFGGLEMANDKWIDKRNIRERKQASLDVESHYTFSEHPKFTSKLLDVYTAFTRRFYDSYARSALYSIFILCHQLVNREAYEGVKNIGGPGTEFHGTCNTVRILESFRDLEGDNLQRRLREIFLIDEVNENDCRKHVPDVVMATEFESDFYLFGDCRPGVHVNCEDVLEEAWHQALRGLCNKPNVFASGMCVNSAHLAEIIVNGSKIDTFVTAFEFRGQSKLNSYKFDTNRLLEFILHLALIVEENSDQRRAS